MPKTIDMDALALKKGLEQRNEYLINIWRSMPGTTGRIEPIPEDKLKIAFAACIGQCREETKETLENTYQQCGWPWKAEKSTRKGRAWTKVLMRAALDMTGLLIGPYRVGEVDGVSKDDHAKSVKELLKVQVYDEWTEEHDRLFDEAKSMALADPGVF
jgi:hypothetical protein